MAARRGLGITSKDMEASRLVFVFVRDSKPKRKVAIPVPDNYTWEQFLDQVKTKLKLSGVADIYFSSNGQKVRSVNELQDIDELCVVEGADAAVANGGAVQRAGADVSLSVESAATEAMLSPSGRQQSVPQERHKAVASADTLRTARSGSYDDEEGKYARRAHPLKRTLQRLFTPMFPNLFAPGLPVTSRDAQGSDDGNSKATRRRRKRSPYDVRNVLLVLATMSCVFTMLYLFFRMSPAAGPPVANGGLAGADVAQHAAVDAAAVAGGQWSGAAAQVAAATAARKAAAAAAGAAAPGGPVAAGVGGGGEAAAGGMPH